MHWTTTQHAQHMRYINYDTAVSVPDMARNTTGIQPMQGLLLGPTLQASQLLAQLRLHAFKLTVPCCNGASYIFLHSA